MTGREHGQEPERGRIVALLDSEWLAEVATHPPLLVVEATLGGVLISVGRNGWWVGLGVFLVSGAALNAARAWARMERLRRSGG